MTPIPPNSLQILFYDGGLVCYFGKRRNGLREQYIGALFVDPNR